MERIVILGCAGSGKTTLARRLGERTSAPVICLDELWQPNWTAKDVPAFRALIQDTHDGGAWISDGNFSVATFDLRLPRASLIIWLETPRWSCACRAITRVFESDETHRLGKLIDVLAFIWRFDRINRPRIEATRLTYGADVPVCRLTGRREIEDFLSSYQKGEE